MLSFIIKAPLIQKEVKIILGEKLKLLRKSRGLSQQELSKKLRYSQSFISLIENGKRTPSLKFLMRVSEFFQIPVESLLGESSADYALDLLLDIMVLWKKLSSDYPEYKFLLQHFYNLNLSQFKIWKIISAQRRDSSSEVSKD